MVRISIELKQSWETLKGLREYLGKLECILNVLCFLFVLGEIVVLILFLIGFIN